ncbi:MAG: hypothetical protein UZ07_CHB004002762 [Chlorobi bacterium OLB7]|nr:MAG: hypothetical protein UZ07_CHB004002762 [Chlorobi bacterium OLB7]
MEALGDMEIADNDNIVARELHLHNAAVSVWPLLLLLMLNQQCGNLFPARYCDVAWVCHGFFPFL